MAQRVNPKVKAALAKMKVGEMRRVKLGPDKSILVKKGKGRGGPLVTTAKRRGKIIRK